MREKNRNRDLTGIVALAVIFVVIASAVSELGEVWTSVHAGFRTIVYAIAAIVGGWLLWRRTTSAEKQVNTALQQLAVMERGHATDRLAKAIEQISSNKIYERIGGIHAFKQIVRTAQQAIDNGAIEKKQHEEDIDAIEQVLRQFVRTTPHQEAQRKKDPKPKPQPGVETPASDAFEPTKSDSDEARIPCRDVQDAFDVLQTISRLTGKECDVSDAFLVGLDLANTDLSGLILRNADFRYANLQGADLRGANLRHATLFGTDLSGSDLRSTDLSHATLKFANLNGADLRNACLTKTDLTHANGIEWAKWDRAWCARNYEPEGVTLEWVNAHLDIPEDQ